MEDLELPLISKSSFDIPTICQALADAALPIAGDLGDTRLYIAPTSSDRLHQADRGTGHPLATAHVVVLRFLRQFDAGAVIEDLLGDLASISRVQARHHDLGL